MKQITLVLLAAVAVSVATACGGSEESPVPAATATGTMPADTTPVQGRSALLTRLCTLEQEPLASYDVQVTARWKDSDRVVIEGRADLPGPGSVNYWICQDGEVTGSLVWARQPTFEDSKIRAESKLVESQVGPAFDPDARFEVILSILGEPVQVPYFTVSVPVEGKPE